MILAVKQQMPSEQLSFRRHRSEHSVSYPINVAPSTILAAVAGALLYFLFL